MTPAEFADRLAFYAGRVRELRGVSRRNPHAFAEDKSELAGAMLDEARRLRAPKRILPPDRAPIGPGIVVTGSGRRVPVEIRRRAS